MRIPSLLVAVVVSLAAPVPLAAGVSVSFDLETMNELLPALAAEEVAVPISAGRSLAMRFAGMQVTGLDPAGDGDGGTGHVLTSMRVIVPQLGLDLPVRPRLSLHAVEVASRSVIELRFERVEIAVPLIGAIDVSPFLTPIQFPAENLWLVEGADGDVQVRSRLTGIDMGRRVVRFDFELETSGAGGGQRTGGGDPG